MALTKTFTSFDFDHDEDLRNLLMGQAKNPGSPFWIADWSVKEAFSGDWKAKVRDRIGRVDLVVVICGEYTHLAKGIAAELQIAREEKKDYFLLWGRNGKTCTKPSNALSNDQIYDWNWENLTRPSRNQTSSGNRDRVCSGGMPKEVFRHPWRARPWSC
jgi:hypothetical protein